MFYVHLPFPHFSLGSGDVYADYETPVFKLGKTNENFSSKTNEVKESIKRYRHWREGELDAENEISFIQKIHLSQRLFNDQI